MYILATVYLKFSYIYCRPCNFRYVIVLKICGNIDINMYMRTEEFLLLQQTMDSYKPTILMLQINSNTKAHSHEVSANLKTACTF